MKYRAEIDGLRAVAVLPVIFFHAGFAPFAGGFVGVDVFFVISGYLITSLIAEELKTGSFSLAGFYDRRARRILPALFFVVLCCIPVAWFILLPKDLTEFLHSVMAVGMFASNILFWLQSGYFDTAAELKPLLHTWSLAVEEQFYIIFPLLLMALWRFGLRPLIAVLAVLFFISLSLAEWGALAYPSATFFLLHARGWELLIGAFAALYLQGRGGIRAGRVGDGLAAAGLLAIAAAVVLFDGRTPFPGLYALVPTVGTALVILFAAPGTLTHRLLSLRACVGIGLISYSMYLWHQPLFVFSRYLFGLPQGSYLFLALTVLTLLLAWITWRFIERPFRKKHFRVRTVLITAAAASIGILTLGVNLPKQIRPAFDALDLQTQWQGWTKCYPFGTREEAGGRCSILDDNAAPTSAIIGDSHAQHLAFGIREVFADTTENPIIFVSGGCFPVVTKGREIDGFMQCAQDFIDKSIAYAIEDQGIKQVVLSGYGVWELLRRRAHEPEHLDPAEIEQRQALLLEGLQETVGRLLASGKQVLLISDNPEMIHSPVHCSTRAAGWFGKCPLRLAREDVDRSLREMDQIIEKLKLSHPELHVHDPRAVFCDAEFCYSGTAAQSWYRDHDHLTPAGAVRLVEDAVGRPE
ncbi:acyltransferase family protein [Roseovarius sp. MMSF_3359]|uniref:acyltransferase family protein n=3 Tax=unclassified Roseovarius TaxID=2614913 RepID=UPI00273E394D|nr:acyltransferase family protein [Roseovarius sp. MMSF_3359]